MIKMCSNDRFLCISNIESFYNELEAGWVPFVVLLTAHSTEEISSAKLLPLIKFLIERGTKTFVCVGEYSEKLHDEIDEILYEYDGDHSIFKPLEILTTYHQDETFEDSISYFIHGTDLPKSEGFGLLALLKTDDDVVLGFLRNA